MYLIIEWNNNNISIPLPFLCSVQYIPPLLHSFINFISLSLSFIILKLSPFDLCIWYAYTVYYVFFIQADRLNPGKWKENLLYVAKVRY